MALLAAGEVLPAAGSSNNLIGNTYLDNQGFLSLLTRSASYGAIYRSQPWVAALVNKLAYATARLPLPVYERTGSSRERRPDSAFAKLLANPNHRDDPNYFWRWTVSTFEVYGEAIWLKVRPTPGRPPTALWPLHPGNVAINRQSDGTLRYHWWLADKEYGPEDVVHFREYNPDDQRRGMSRLEPLRDSLVSDEAIRRAQEAIWSHGARPSVVLQHPSELSDTAQRRLRSTWQATYGGVDNWGKAAILEEGMTASVLQLSASDMQATEMRKLSRDECAAVYDVPPPVVHILDRATFSNITEQMRSMYRDTMAPRLGLYESVIDKQLRPDFDPQGKFYAEFLLDEVLRGDFEMRVDAYQKGITSGWIKPAEVRALENLPAAGLEADRLYVNSALVPMSSQSSVPAPPSAGQKALEVMPPALTPEAWGFCVTKVMGRLGREIPAIESLTEGLPEHIGAAIAGQLHVNGYPTDVAEVRSIVRTVMERHR